MRRLLHCLLVGVLVCSLSIDTARACWYLRHAHRGYAVPACPPAPVWGGGWCVVSDVPVMACAEWCGGPTVVRVESAWVEEIACGAPVECCGETIVATAPATPLSDATGVLEHAATVVVPRAVPAEAEPALAIGPAGESAAPALPETVARPAPTPAIPVEDVVKPAPIAAAPAAEGVLPNLRPVEPASAIEPVAPAPRPEPAAEATAVPDPAAAANAEKTPEKIEEKMEERPADVPADPAGEPAADVPEPTVPRPEPPAVPAVEVPAETTEPVAPLEAEAPQPTEPEMKEPPAEVAPETDVTPPAAAPAARPAPAEEPAEANLFEEVEAPEPPADEPAATVDEAAVPDEPAAPPEDADEKMEEEPAADAAAEEAETSTEPAAPAAEESPPAAEEESATEDAPAADEPSPFSSREPARRWIDSTSRYATVGTLVAVTGGQAEIRKPDGRLVRVPLDRLSDHDRQYASEAEPRLLARRPAPEPGDTAGL